MDPKEIATWIDPGMENPPDISNVWPEEILFYETQYHHTRHVSEPKLEKIKLKIADLPKELVVEARAGCISTEKNGTWEGECLGPIMPKRPWTIKLR